MIELLQAATLVQDRELQKRAEATLLQKRSQHPQEFFQEAAKVFNSRSVDHKLRLSAGTVLLVSVKEKDENSFLWQRVPKPAQSEFKDAVLNTMVDPERPIRRAAANIVAVLCCIDVPLGQWEGIIQKITASISHQDPIVKEASILTLGFICEQLKAFNFQLEPKRQETILTGILMALKDSHLELVETALKALRDGMPAMTSVMEISECRQYLISQLIEAIAKRISLELCMQALLEFVRYNFVHMTPTYIEIFATHLLPLMKNTQDQSICVIATEFWSAFARQQHNCEGNPTNKKFISGALGDQLVQLALQNLCFVEETDQEANGISEGAAGTLEAIFDEDSTEFEKKVLGFAQNTLQHQNWKYRQASIRAFALLLLGLPPTRSQFLVDSSLVQLVKLLDDPVGYVQLSALKSLCLITQEVPEVFLRHEKCLEILNFIVTMGKQEHFLKHVCKIVDNLSLPDSATGILGPHAAQMTKIFMDFILDKNRKVQHISYCFTTVINLIKCSQSVPLSISYIDFVLSHFKDIYSIGQEKRELFSSGFLTIVQVCLMSIRKNGGSITIGQVSTLYDLVVDHYKKIEDVDGDGYYLVSALAFFVPNDRRLIDDFWKYIDFGLKKTQQEDVFKSTISCICDFASTYREQISDKVDPVIEEIFSLYQKSSTSRELKLDILMCIGELFLQCGDFCFKHFKRAMQLIYRSCKGVFSVADINYAEAMQDSIIETLMCMIHGTDNMEMPILLSENMSFITEFVRITTEKSKKPKLEYVQSCLMFLGDVANLFPQERQKLQKTNFLQERVMTLMKFNKDGSLNQCIAYARQQFKISI